MHTRRLWEKTVDNVEQILTDHEEDLTSCRERLMVLKSLLTEKMETIKKLDEAILESIKLKEFEKEIEDSGEFCETMTNEQVFTYNPS